MPVRIETKNENVTAFLEGELDHHAARSIREQIDDTVHQVRPKMLMLDFGKVTFMDSSGIGLVMGRYKLMSSLGGKVCIVNPSPHIAKVMRLAGMDRLAFITRQDGKKGEAHI